MELERLLAILILLKIPSILSLIILLECVVKLVDTFKEMGPCNYMVECQCPIVMAEQHFISSQDDDHFSHKFREKDVLEEDLHRTNCRGKQDGLHQPA